MVGKGGNMIETIDKRIYGSHFIRKDETKARIGHIFILWCNFFFFGEKAIDTLLI